MTKRHQSTLDDKIGSSSVSMLNRLRGAAAAIFQPAPPLPQDWEDGVPPAGSTDAERALFVDMMMNEESQNTTDTNDSFASASAVAPRPASFGAMETATGGARAAAPLFIVNAMHEIRLSLGKGDSSAPAPASFQGRLCVEIRHDANAPDATTFAFDGVKVWFINWKRLRREFLLDDNVPCAREGCEGHTKAGRYGCEDAGGGGVVQILRTDGQYDYITAWLNQLFSSTVIL